MRRAALGALGKRRGAAAAAAATVPDTAPAARWGWRGRVFLPAGSGLADKGGGGGGGGDGACLSARALCGVARPRGARWFTSLGGAGEEGQGGEEENPRVFLDVKIGAEAPQRITFEVRSPPHNEAAPALWQPPAGNPRGHPRSCTLLRCIPWWCCCWWWWWCCCCFCLKLLHRVGA
jgi:hypothetical protein